MSSGEYDWLAIQAYYLAHPELSAKEVAQYMEVNPITMERKVTSEGWAKLRKAIEEEGRQQLIQNLIEKNYQDKQSRLDALSKIIQRFVDDPQAKVSDAGAIAAIKQIGLMLGEVSQRTETTVLVYEVSTAGFPQPKIIEGNADLIEGDFDEDPPQLGPGENGQSEKDT